VIDVLDQSDINALLAAVDNGLVDQAVTVRGNGRAYDFNCLEHFSKAQLLALQTPHENFAQDFSTDISGQLHINVQVSVTRIEQITYGEFIQPLPNPSCCHLLKSDESNSSLCLQINPTIVFPIIDRLLGGNQAETLIPQRALTQIEQRMVRQWAERVAHHLSHAWSSLIPVTLRVDQFVSDPQLLRMMPLQSPVVVVVFTLKVGNHAGIMSICIPCHVIEPFVKRIAHDDLEVKVSAIPMEMRALLAQTAIKRADLLSLSVGDIITTDQSVEKDVLIQIEGKDKFIGRLVQFRGKRAVCITKSGSVP